tara:strand:+ start:5259 stop:5432 length:174 start_codon:yes stop_codon:yes gene_type:complete
MKKKNLNTKEVIAIENKASKSIIGDIVSNGILTPQRVEELFFKALGDVLKENKEGSK